MPTTSREAKELTPRERIIVALDVPTADEALALAERVGEHVGAFKVGLELINAAGFEVLRELNRRGRVFYDAKFHDIPNTVAGAMRAVGGLGLWMVNVHASGGSAMLRAASDAVAEADPRPLVIAVTVLTSIDAATLREELGVDAEPVKQVVRLAKLAQKAGLDGVVASPLEAAAIRQQCGPEFVIVTPGVRPRWAATGDQRRVTTPAEAVANGADYLVIGRPITAADDPAAAARRILEELA